MGGEGAVPIFFRDRTLSSAILLKSI